jgi:exocyst complex protein 7
VRVLFDQLWSQEEYSLLTQLAPLPGQAHLPATYAALLTPLTTLFNTTLSSLSTLIKRSLHKYTFHALASYSVLSTCQDRWDDLITRRAERKENELKEGLHALRGVCLRSFPEFLADLKLAGMGKGGGEIGTGCADFTITVRHSHGLINPSLTCFHLDYALSGAIARGSRCCRTRFDVTR